MARLRAAWAWIKEVADHRWQRAKWHVRRWATGRRWRKVVLVGMYAPYNGEFGPAEVWGCNWAFRHHGQMDRVFAMDALAEFQAKDPGWVEQVNARGVPVVMQRCYGAVPLSEPFPLDAARREICARDYYTSTIAYMAEEAIRLGYGSIVFHCVLVRGHSDEYIEQKACLDFWAGVAYGLGLNVVISDNSQIARPYPWQSGLYGYVTQDNWVNAAKMMASTMNAIERMDKTFRRAA